MEGIPEDVKAYVLSEVESSHADDRVGVSELGGCLRKAWFKRRMPRPVDFESAFRMFVGRLFHIYIERGYEKTEVSVQHKVGKGVIVGKIDAIVGDTAIDFKSKRDIRFVSERGPQERDVNQVKFYAFAANLQHAKLIYYKIDPKVQGVRSTDEFLQELKRGIVLEAIQSPRISFDIEMHDVTNVVRNYVTRALILFDALEDERPPALETPPPPWECKFCEFREICKAFP